VAQAVLKGDHMDDVVRDVTMMGAAAIRPVVTDHVVVPGRALASPRLAERWRRVALGSAKQCGRAVVPDILAPCLFADVMRGDAPVLMLVEPSRAGTATPAEFRRLCGGAAEVVLLVGPEGGWSDEEVGAAAGGGVHCWSLGPRTLRADRAAMVAISVLDYLAAVEGHPRDGGAPNAG
jgi:16S rRNA (uracil1498-N3)-methyltransferase